MKNFKTSTILAAAGALLLAVSAHATSHEKVVHSTNGNLVVDRQGDCVVTKWEATTNECKGGKAVSATELRTVYFGFNSSALTKKERNELNTLAKSLKSDNVSAVKIVGFADEIGSEGYNDKLSMKRANTVASYLRNKGIQVNGTSEIRGLGESSSVSDCEGKTGAALRACLWQDRRVEVEIVE